MHHTLTLETKQLILRRPVAADLPQAQAFFMSDRARGIGGPYTPGRAWRQFAAELGHWDIMGFGMWTVTRRGDDTALGLVGPWCPVDWPETEIGWMMFGNAEGKGFAFEAARAALDHAFGTLGWTTAVSYVGRDNTSSATLAKRLGAVLDPAAPNPYPDDPCDVYRHPKPEGLI